MDYPSKFGALLHILGGCKVRLWWRGIPKVGLSAQLTKAMKAHLNFRYILQDLVSHPEVYEQVLTRWVDGMPTTEVTPDTIW